MNSKKSWCAYTWKIARQLINFLFIQKWLKVYKGASYIPLGVLPLKHRDQPKATAIAPEWYRVRVLPRWRSKPLCSSHKGSWCFCWKSNFEVPHGPENSFNINQTFLALQMSVISSQTKKKGNRKMMGVQKKSGLLLFIEGHIRVVSSWHFCWMKTPPPRHPKTRESPEGPMQDQWQGWWACPKQTIPVGWERFFDSPGEIKTTRVVWFLQIVLALLLPVSVVFKIVRNIASAITLLMCKEVHVPSSRPFWMQTAQFS